MSPGQAVYIQNQRGMGKASKMWDRSGVVLENNGFDKYTIKGDGSGRVIDRNRKYLRSFIPENSQLLDDAQVSGTPVTVQAPREQPSPIDERILPVAPEATEPPDGGEMNENPTPAPDATVTSDPVVGLRQSGRVRRGNSKY